ncbi:predicted protein [Nematostella vectensis]|uniref:DNA polymerase alpha/delta/epsilon subunit B domain-containing protein n=1 Tax=Nematostella vectensis TaxID=45351 RepID=A7T3U6_NEMVE|nr:predicted protein [Nematostella vectensis]|eukprot:XP_001621468.1 hypothetical protein NEMVEDRAFT_v1g221960 [Nematostella vectensis]
MPGEFDPTNHALPQQPLHRCMFPEAIAYPTMQSVTNPYEAVIGGIRVLGTSGQNVSDISKVTTFDNSMDILEQNMVCSHLAPTAPDTLDCYPYADQDPFILEKCPHVYFASNQPSYQSKVLTGKASYQHEILTGEIPASNQSKVLIGKASNQHEILTGEIPASNQPKVLTGKASDQSKVLISRASYQHEILTGEIPASNQSKVLIGKASNQHEILTGEIPESNQPKILTAGVFGVPADIECSHNSYSRAAVLFARSPFPLSPAKRLCIMGRVKHLQRITGRVKRK